MQTAVGWLIEQMLINNYTSKQQIENAHWLINEAKEMERLQLIDAQSYAISNADMTNNKGYFDCDKWYNETYNSNSEKPNLSENPTPFQIISLREILMNYENQWILLSKEQIEYMLQQLK